MRNIFLTLRDDNFIKEHDLEDLFISKNKLSKVLFGIGINPKEFIFSTLSGKSSEVKKLLRENLLQKFKTGQTVFLEVDNFDENSLSNYKSLAEGNFYNFTILFRDNEIPQRTINKFKNYLFHKDNFSMEDISIQMKKRNSINIDSYENVYVIGDIQGCYFPLNKFFSQKDILNQNNLFIFIGDYLDRGLQNDLVMEFLINNYNRSNFLFVMGNHEKYLMDFYAGNHHFYKGFDQKTIPQIDRLDKNEIINFLKVQEDFLILELHKENIFLSHGGNIIKDIHANLARIPSSEFWFGTNGYDFDIDDYKLHEGYKIIHGHRNIYKKPILNGRSFNLEGQVEYGKELRVLQITPSDKELLFTGLFYKNDFFDETLEEHEFYKKVI